MPSQITQLKTLGNTLFKNPDTLTKSGINFFRDLFIRVGGIRAMTNLELEAISNEERDVTISGGIITVTNAVINRRFYTIETEGAAATDDLDTINGGNAGEILIIQTASSDRSVIVKDGTSLRIQADFTLNHKTDKIMLVCISSGVWDELTRASNGT